MKYFGFIIVVASFFIPHSVLAEKSAIVIGVGAAMPDFQHAIDVEGDSEPSAQMVADRKLVPMVQIMTLPSPIVDIDGFRWLRWSIEFGAYPFQVTKQVENRVSDVIGSDVHNLGNEVDMGTEIKGFMGYLNPTISVFHRFSDSIYAYLGFGAGLGYAAVKGEYYVTAGSAASAACLSSGTLDSIKTNCERRDVSFDQFALGSNAILGASFGPIGLRYGRGGPTFKEGRFQHKPIGSIGAILIQFTF